MEFQKDDEYLRVLIDDFLKLDKGSRHNFLKYLIMMPDSIENSEIESFLDGMEMDDNDKDNKITMDLLKMVSYLEKDLRSTFVECLTKQLDDEDTEFVLQIMNSLQAEDVEPESNKEKHLSYVIEEDNENKNDINGDREEILKNRSTENVYIKLDTKNNFESKLTPKDDGHKIDTKGDNQYKMYTKDFENKIHINNSDALLCDTIRSERGLINDILKLDIENRQKFLKYLIGMPDLVEKRDIESYLDDIYKNNNDKSDKTTMNLLKLVSTLQKNQRLTFVECLISKLNNEDTALIFTMLNNDIEVDTNGDKEKLNIKEVHVQEDSEYLSSNFVHEHYLENAFLSVKKILPIKVQGNLNIKRDSNPKDDEHKINTINYENKNNNKQKRNMKDENKHTIKITNNDQHNMHINLREDKLYDFKYFQNNASGENYFENDELLIKVISSVPSDSQPKIFTKSEYEHSISKKNNDKQQINISVDYESEVESTGSDEHRKQIKTEKNNNEHNVKRSNDEQNLHIKNKRKNEQQTNIIGDYDPSNESFKKQLIRSNEYIFKCGLCSVESKTKELLQQHQESVHKPNDNVCDICGKQFSFKYRLKDHRLSHTGNHFLCDKCNKKFKTPDILKGHIRLSHTGIYEYQCDKCSKCFNLKRSLISHQFVHKESKDFMCDQCSKSFLSPMSLERHIKTHGEKRYACSGCGKGFFILGNLKAHERVHNGDKPYICDVCKKGFGQKGNLKSHQEKCSKKI